MSAKRKVTVGVLFGGRSVEHDVSVVTGQQIMNAFDGERYDEDDVMPAIDAGAEDVALDGDLLKVLTQPTDLTAVRQALEQAGVEVRSAELAMEPKTTVEIGETEAASLLRLIEVLDDHDDVDQVHANFDIADEVLEALDI